MTETEAPPPRSHSRDLKARRCRGCGQLMAAHELHRHEHKCRVAQVRPGDRFEVLLQTTVGGKHGKRNYRRPVEVEIIEALDTGGWRARSMLSGRELVLKSAARFLNWKTYAPGVTRRKRSEGEN